MKRCGFRQRGHRKVHVITLGNVQLISFVWSRWHRTRKVVFPCNSLAWTWRLCLIGGSSVPCNSFVSTRRKFARKIFLFARSWWHDGWRKVFFIVGNIVPFLIIGNIVPSLIGGKTIPCYSFVCSWHHLSRYKNFFLYSMATNCSFGVIKVQNSWICAKKIWRGRETFIRWCR